jgi:acetylornithine deacetylase/succinyl-diaminopimelate desuccinylase-like protein
MTPGFAATRRRLAASVALAFLAAGCALNRPHVKSLRDHEAHKIQFDNTIATTVGALNAIPSHCGPTLDHRVRPEEFRVYEVVGRIARAKREMDHDIHIVLEDPEDPHATLVTESDDPNFRGNTESPYRAKLGDARAMLEDLLRETGAPEWKDLVGVTVRVTGVGFFDLNHFQVGRSRSCIELHPILKIERVQ